MDAAPEEGLSLVGPAEPILAPPEAPKGKKSKKPSKPKQQEEPKEKEKKQGFSKTAVEGLIKRVVKAMALTISGDAEGAKKETLAIIKEVNDL